MQRVHSVFNICKCSSKVRWLKPGTVQRTFSKDQTIQRDSVCFLQILKTFSSAVLIKTSPAEKCRENQRLTMDTCGDSKIIRLHWRLFFTTKEVVTFFLLKLSLLIHGDECDSITAGVMTEWGASLTTTCLQTVAQKESEDLDPDSDWIQVLNPSLLLLCFLVPLYPSSHLDTKANMWHHRHYWELKSTLYQNSTYKNVHLFCCSSTSTTRGSKNPTRFDPSLTPGLYVSLDLWHRHKQLLPLNTDLTGWQHDWSLTDYFYWFWKNISKTLSCFGTPWQRERAGERARERGLSQTLPIPSIWEKKFQIGSLGIQY